jgi:hypothetical protein
MLDETSPVGRYASTTIFSLLPDWTKFTMRQNGMPRRLLHLDSREQTCSMEHNCRYYAIPNEGWKAEYTALDQFVKACQGSQRTDVRSFDTFRMGYRWLEGNDCQNS